MSGLIAPPARAALTGLALLVAACAAPPAKVSAFRPAKAPIYSAAAFVPAQIEGRWHQAATFSADGQAGCKAGSVAFQPVAGGGLAVSGGLCLNGQTVSLSGPVQMAGPGRLSVPGMADWWVLWVDSGYRTLAIGTPDGRFGFVLDRGQIGADRMAAAAEIFDFNGYAKARLQPF